MKDGKTNTNTETNITMDENSNPKPTESEATEIKIKSNRSLNAEQKTLAIAWMREHAEELHDNSAMQLMPLVTNGVGFPVSDSTMPFLCANAGVRLKVRPKPVPKPKQPPKTLAGLAARLERSEKAFNTFKSETQDHIARLSVEIQNLKAPSLALDDQVPGIVPPDSPPSTS